MSPRPVPPRLDPGKSLCGVCVNDDGCPLRRGRRKPIRTCEEFDYFGDILGPIPRLDELGTV